MAPHRAFLVLSILAASLSTTTPAAARANCSVARGRALRTEVAESTAVFVGRLARVEPADPLPADHRGQPDVWVTFRVTQVLKGALQRDDMVRVRWRGWAEREDGPIVGGCRVPEVDLAQTEPLQMIVFARGETELLVRNHSSSQRILRRNRDFVRQVAQLTRR